MRNVRAGEVDKVATSCGREVSGWMKRMCLDVRMRRAKEGSPSHSSSESALQHGKLAIAMDKINGTH